MKHTTPSTFWRNYETLEDAIEIPGRFALAALARHHYQARRRRLRIVIRYWLRGWRRWRMER